MKAFVVSDDQGRIISISKPGDVGDQPSGIAEAGIFPEAGQHIHYIDLPAELEKKPLLDLHTEFRVDLRGERPRLVKAQDFTEPFREKKY